MYEPVVSVSPTPKKALSLTRAEALEAEITDLCAHINAASYRLLQLVAALDDEAPGAPGDSLPAPTGSTGAVASDSTLRAKKSASRMRSNR